MSDKIIKFLRKTWKCDGKTETPIVVYERENK